MKPLMKVQSSETIHLLICTFVSEPYIEWAHFYIYISLCNEVNERYVLHYLQQRTETFFANTLSARQRLPENTCIDQYFVFNYYSECTVS